MVTLLHIFINDRASEMILKFGQNLVVVMTKIHWLTL